ncbi:MAG: hypothetical protein AAGI49_19530, partial [Bacteroidota bacterium]
MKIFYQILALSCCLSFSIALQAQVVNPKLAKQLEQTMDSMRQVVKANGMSVAIQLPDDAIWA